MAIVPSQWVTVNIKPMGDDRVEPMVDDRVEPFIVVGDRAKL